MGGPLGHNEKNAKREYHYLMYDDLIILMDEAIEICTQFIAENKHHFSTGIRAKLHGDLSDNFVVDKYEKIWLIDWEN